ncbi:Sec-independent protein translocase protein TatA (modular protein) [uncultured Paludibacter sp.]|nr:Sec-independent protein translocase protein TatA (modular protein) [uncultured Paludibacter sp.]
MIFFLIILIFVPINEYLNNLKNNIMNIGAPEVILIALVVLLIFGGKKIPELMKGLGKGVSSFKKGMKDIEDDIKEEPTETKK